MMPKVQRKTIKETDRWKARLEEFESPEAKILFVHVEVKDEIDKALITELRHEFNEYKKLIKSAGYDVIHSYSATPKFYKLFEGWEEIGDMQGEFEGYKVIKWDLK